MLVINKTGKRTVEVGPKTVLLEYDETLMPLELSTGRPKTDTKLFRTPYLRITNNRIGDKINVETQDLVQVSVEISLLVNFEGSPKGGNKWFETENYVRVLTDNVRSRMRNAVKRVGVQEFYANATNIIRDAILGASTDGKRSGLLFAENNMRISDIDVLDVTIEDPSVRKLLTEAQANTLLEDVQLHDAKEDAKRIAEFERLRRAEMDEKEKTATREAERVAATTKRALEQGLAQAESALKINEAKAAADLILANAERDLEEIKIELDKKRSAQEMIRIAEETLQYTKRAEAFTPKLIAAIQALGDKQFAQGVIEAIGPAALAAGVTTSDMLAKVFAGTSLESIFNALNKRPTSTKDVE